MKAFFTRSPLHVNVDNRLFKQYHLLISHHLITIPLIVYPDITFAKKFCLHHIHALRIVPESQLLHGCAAPPAYGKIRTSIAD